VLVGCVISPPLRAEEPAQPNLFPVATINVVHIFKTYQPAVEKLDALRADVKELDEKIQLRQIELEQLQRKLAGRPQPGEDREKMQLQFAKLQTELRLYVERERQNVQRREAKIQVDIYKLIQAEVEQITKERGIKLVLVRPRPSLDSPDLQEVGRALNQSILHSDCPDLTDDVLKALETE
jgi:Skp family chaperone for outer membrane proteins